MGRWRSVAVAGLLVAASLAIPASALADTADAGSADAASADAPQPVTIVVTPLRPYWRMAPPSTDPSSPSGIAPGIVQVSGVVAQQTDGQVVLDVGADQQQAVSLPSQVDPTQIQPGERVDATGVLNGEGVLQPLELTLYPTDS